jgi:hypothetical protein
MEVIDRKFRILAVNPCNGHIYTEKNSLLLCAKDKAVVPALLCYLLECQKLNANKEHLESIQLLISRVRNYQEEVESRVPDTVGECEIKRCIDGEGVD